MTKKNLYPVINSNHNFAEMEEQILKFWQEHQVFKKSIEIRNSDDLEDQDNTSPIIDSCALKDHRNCRHHDQAKNEFVFYDGPPFANGLPHYGHLLTGFIKDLFARYQTMKGNKVERRFGWDTHGLPVEMETEKELSKSHGKNISGQIAIKEFGIEKFNDACQKSVMKYADEWEYYVTRQGRFVDFKNSYKTMDLSYMESVIWAFKQLYDKGLVYESMRVVPYSWACETPLSNFETKMDNAYRQKASKTVKVKFYLNQTPKFLSDLSFDCKIALIAWTTTPWTLPSNLALAVNKNIEYAVISSSQNNQDEILILAYSLIEKFTKELGQFKIIKTINGNDLIGLDYHPIFPYFKEFKSGSVRLTSKAGEILQIPEFSKIFTILHGDFVSIDQGTGIVHIAPGFGEDDQIICDQNKIPTICPVDESGKFNSIIINKVLLEIFKQDYNQSNLPQLQGKQVFETNDDIIKYLKETNQIFGNPEQILHDYPHCWRTDTPLIYKAVSSWYVKVTAFKDRMVELNQQINWIPSHVKEGQFGKWLEGARDWSITRNRFWGCPVPVWKTKSGKIKVFGSIAELEEQVFKSSGKKIKIDNLHRPFIDNIKFIEDGEEYQRVSDVLDCWFESGSMPYAQVHYPFENKDWFEQNFPADFITEYQAQTRGWFYTLMVLSTALFDRAPFKNVICHGTILDENAQKLSKRLKNYPDPINVFNSIGSDAMRFYMISQPVMRGQELKIDREGKAIHDTLRLSIKPLFNAFNFFCLYANADQIQAKRIEFSRKFNNILDQYIFSKLKSTVIKIDQSLASFDTVRACEEFDYFFEVLNNWYIRRNRHRFWKSELDQDKQDAYDVLYTILLIMSETSASLIPFTSEFIWKNLSIDK